MSSTILDSKAAELERFQSALDGALSRGRTDYDALFDSPPEGLSAHEIDLGRTLVRVSKAHTRLLGYPPELMVGRPASTFIILKETSERAMDHKLAGRRQLKPFVRAFRKADGTAVTLLLLDRHVAGDAGAVIGIRTVLTPIPAEVVVGL
jgi:PAS domain S-box-containing protein